ncbi:hypothetical protein GDO81_017284 [Engystomops pustulosus]|uniref:Uncharacterized protein n=1 Tax=Engystomops pustulosus TaxID=76066 RepID=A0AAV7ADJ2_ENGPU|nr:hypothetical protein GDO81_017284 [Engystomops pustulosus]
MGVRSHSLVNEPVLVNLENKASTHPGFTFVYIRPTECLSILIDRLREMFYLRTVVSQYIHCNQHRNTWSIIAVGGIIYR